MNMPYFRIIELIFRVNGRALYANVTQARREKLFSLGVLKQKGGWGGGGGGRYNRSFNECTPHLQQQIKYRR